MEVWEKFISGLDNLGQIKIPRWTRIDEIKPSELHIFVTQVRRPTEQFHVKSQAKKFH
jgi:hypothetical protein